MFSSLGETSVCMNMRPCLNGGTCVDLNGGSDYRCKCSEHFFGKDCEKVHSKL